MMHNKIKNENAYSRAYRHEIESYNIKKKRGSSTSSQQSNVRPKRMTAGNAHLKWKTFTSKADDCENSNMLENFEENHIAVSLNGK